MNKVVLKLKIKLRKKTKKEEEEENGWEIGDEEKIGGKFIAHLRLHSLKGGG